MILMLLQNLNRLPPTTVMSSKSWSRMFTGCLLKPQKKIPWSRIWQTKSKRWMNVSCNLIDKLHNQSTNTTICHYHYNNHHHLSLSLSQTPPSVTIIITNTTICHYHHHKHHHLPVLSSETTLGFPLSEDDLTGTGGTEPLCMFL